ncbi:pseudouridine synthase [bacterium]|nr:pseudouridine synthase [bacterium]
MTFQYIIFNKPYDVLSQFTPAINHQSLSDFGFPKNVYPAGRLDADSEGLLLLTDDGNFAHQLIDRKYGHSRTYWVQVERIPSSESLAKLEKGVIIEGKKTKPAKVRLLPDAPDLPERSKPIRYRKNISTAWIEITLTEGRNRQVRKMTAAIGHPTLRLIRITIMSLTLENLNPGQWRKLNEKEVTELKRLFKKRS